MSSKGNALALLNRRRVMMICEDKPYIELEAIESDGNQYIDCKIYQSSMTRVQSIFSITENNSTRGVFGSRGNISLNLFTNVSAADRFRLDMISTYTFSASSYIGEKVVFDYNPEEEITTLNDESFVTSTSDTAICTYNSLLFTFNNRGTPYDGASMVVYTYKLSEDNLDLLDFIPVRLTSDIPASLSSKGIAHSSGEVGMWDKVSNTFFGNSGTGEFIAHYKS